MGNDRKRFDSDYWFRVILCLRIFISITQISSDVPDEFFQGPEVAHRRVFGYGHETWEWRARLRSGLHPLIYSSIYQSLKWLRADFSFLLMVLPRLLHAFVSSYAEIRFCELTAYLCGSQCATWTAFGLSTCIFTNHCFTRTLSNSLETSLTMIALSYYPCYSKTLLRAYNEVQCSWKYLIVAAIACLIRPTAIVIWAPLGFWHLMNSHRKFSLALQAIVVALVSLGFSVAIDSFFYGEITFPMWNFLRFNFLTDSNKVFGVNDTFWYLTVGMPGVLATYMPFFVFGLVKYGFTGGRVPGVFTFLILWCVSVYSIPPHKEMRFILPVLPLMLVVVSVFMISLPRKVQSILWKSLLFINGIVTCYLSYYHQSGTVLSAMYLNHKLSGHPSPSALILLPCFSMPHQSVIHQNVTIDFLECPPNFDSSPNHINPTDIFMRDPVKWMASNDVSKYSFIVIYEHIYEMAKSTFEANDLVKLKSFHQSHFPEYEGIHELRVAVLGKNFIFEPL